MDGSRFTRKQGMAAVRRTCERHATLTGQALLDLAAWAAAGHLAHLHLYAADQQLGPSSALPTFLARGAQSAGLRWDMVVRLRADLRLRREFENRHHVGNVATAHLVALAEPMILCAVRRMLRSGPRSTVVGVDDLVNVGRTAVAQGAWAFDPTAGEGVGYLVQRIDEALKRELLSTGSSLSVSHRAERIFRRVHAIRNRLRDDLGREPSDSEMIEASQGALTADELELERRTRVTRQRVRQLDPGIDELADAQRHALPEEVADRGVPGWQLVVSELGLDGRSVEILSRLAALPPFAGEEEETLSERRVADVLGISRSAVRSAVRGARRAFVDESGRGRALLRTLGPDEREGLGLQSFVQALDRRSA
jgi:DNA-directed RNA polymerase specialized sigma subunit